MWSTNSDCFRRMNRKSAKKSCLIQKFSGKNSSLSADSAYQNIHTHFFRL